MTGAILHTHKNKKQYVEEHVHDNKDYDCHKRIISLSCFRVEEHVHDNKDYDKGARVHRKLEGVTSKSMSTITRIMTFCLFCGPLMALVSKSMSTITRIMTLKQRQKLQRLANLSKSMSTITRIMTAYILCLF